MEPEPNLEKVTAFVIRPGAPGRVDELLLFEHPYAGIQLPAGTVEEGEAHAAAVVREAGEETGLTGFEAPEYIGHEDWPVPDDKRLTLRRATVYARPDPISFDWSILPRGTLVSVQRAADGYLQVSYTEWDRLPDPQFASMQITGWVAGQHLTSLQRRHFYILTFCQATPPTWTVEIDHHRFRPFWARLDALPRLLDTQAPWLRFLAARYPALSPTP